MDFVKDALFLKEKVYNIKKRINTMALTLGFKYLYAGSQKVEGASLMRITVEKSYLSVPYEIKPRTKISGEIITFYEKNMGGVTKISGMPPLKVDFILMPANVGTDSLYISEESWAVMRDYGLLPDKIVLDIILRTIHLGDEKIEIYPKRNVRV